MKTNNNSGVVLVAVVCFTAITAILALGLWSESGSQLKLADRQVRLEQAFYVAEGGAERAVSCIRNSVGNPPGVITGAIGNGTYSVAINLVNGGGGQTWYTITSTGEVNSIRKAVTMTGVRQQSWARYAMWYNTGPSDITIAAGDFYGRIHANCKIKITGDPHFYDLVSSAATNWTSGTDLSGAIFDQGYVLGAPTQTLSSINFTNTASSNCLRTLAGLVVTGATSIRLQSTNVFISNSQRGWTNVNYTSNNPSFLSTGLIYVASSGTQTGTVQIGGTNFHGRLTVATEWDVLITNHITLAVHPTNNSDDAIGLLSRHNIFIATNCPKWLNVYAHMVADGSATPSDLSDGKFEVVGWDSRDRSKCETMTVYGGIIQNYRGYTSDSSGSHGYYKNYIYDLRFEDNPPPFYPTMPDQYAWQGWRDKP
ncbi:MAG: hypothetical protein NT011_08515 [Kiritimatiellaeota bacterium]|nr:hypothetical protein [Kiritimatiellota bacterium]